jgi:hypothetical protein
MDSDLLDPAVRRSMRVLVESEIMGERLFGIAERHVRATSDRRMWPPTARTRRSSTMSWLMSTPSPNWGAAHSPTTTMPWRPWKRWLGNVPT